MRCDICMSGEDEVELRFECGGCQEEHRKANDKRLAAAEARAAYCKASFLVEMAKKGDVSAGCAESQRVDRDRAREKLRALGVGPLCPTPT